ncbi:Acriflavin resistance protein, partial [human gut metagenome]
IDVGIETATTNEALPLFKKSNITKKAITALKIRFFITSFIELFIYSLVSLTIFKLNCEFSLLSSLVIAVGMVVDNATVVIENIFKYRKDPNLSLEEAAI